MVQLMRSGGLNLRPDPDTATIRDKFPVKSEIEEDSLEEEHGPHNKRSKSSSTPFNEFCTGTNEFPIPPSQYNPLDEPSPLGLRLRKSPSLLDLIQMRLSQGNASSAASTLSENLNLQDKEDVKGTTTVATNDKLKASNFPALLLRIGKWEYMSRYEGDLVAKCYFAKHKIVWEILEGGLKSKIEIQWSDIMALKTNFPDDGPGTLTVTLARPPLFFKETNPQPRKHTLWQATVDFTDGEASIHRLHYLQCAQGLLNKQYEKLIQCDMRLNLISRQPEMVLDSPYFKAPVSVYKDSNGPNFSGPNVQEVDQLKTAKTPPISGFQDVASPSAAESCSFKFEEQNYVGTTSKHLSPKAPSPSSVMDLRAMERNGSHGGNGFKAQPDWEQLKTLGIRPSMSMSDLVNHIGHCISERMASGNLQCSKEALECRDMLEDIAHVLLSDTQFATASDEKTLMSRVNSLCSLLQDPATAANVQVDTENHSEGHNEGRFIQTNHSSEPVHENKAGSDSGVPLENSKDVPSCKQAPAMSRKDSYGDLLLNLPRITSLPKFLFDISEDDENQAR